MLRLSRCLMVLPGMFIASTTPSGGAERRANADSAIKPTARKTHAETITAARHRYRITLGGQLDEDNTLAWRPVHGRSTIEWPRFQPNVSVTIENVGQTDVRSTWLVVNGRDWYDIDSLLGSIITPDMTDRQKAFAVFELFKRCFYHYNVAECRLGEDGRLTSDVLDPVKMFNMYENNGCSLHAINLATLWKRAGIEARVWNYKSIHWVSEARYDGAWHMLDADQRCFFLMNDNETVAGCEDWPDNRYLLRRTHHPGDFARTDVEGDAKHATHYLDENSGRPFRAESDHRMDVHLRPGEKIVYRWDNIGKFHDNWRHKKSVPKYANGRFVYAPDFSRPHAERGAIRRNNVSGFGSPGGELTPTRAGQPAELVYGFVSPYVLVGGTVELTYRRADQDEFVVDISFDGKQWKQLWRADKAESKTSAKIPLDAAIAPRSTDAKYRYWLRYRMKAARTSADVALCGMVVTTDFQANLNALPSLRLGVNEIAYRDATDGAHRVRITHDWQECDALQPPPAPVPADALEITHTLSPVLRWTQPPSPQGRPIAHFRTQVRFDETMRVPVCPNLERVVAGDQTQWQTPDGWLLPDKTYYWRVRTRDQAGIWSPWSRVVSFRLQGPGPIEGLRIDGMRLTWQRGSAGTKPARYEVHGSDKRGFTPTQATALARTDRTDWPITAAGARRYYRVRAIDDGEVAGPISAPVEAGPIRSRLLDGVRIGPNHARDAKLTATGTVREYKVEAAADGDPKTLWAGGQGTDLRLHPADVIVDFGQAKLVDTVVLTTDRLKNQLRLEAVAVYAWAGDDWDGRPVFQTADNTQTLIVAKFPAVKTSRLCISCLDTARPDHSFAHLNEVEVYGSAGEPVRELTPSGLPPSIAAATHDLADLDAQIERLRGGGEIGRLRAEHLTRRRAMLVEALEWRRKLDAETKRTEALTKQGAPEWAVALRDALKRYRLWTHWWISHQQEDGQFGGQYGDDVELCCGWPLLCLAQDDPTTYAALKRLGDGLWQNIPAVRKFGFDVYSDVEHSAEPTSYSQPRMVVLDRTDSVYVKRCKQTTETVIREWMGVNRRGRLQFKSSWFGYDRQMKPRVNPEAMYDIPECAKALKPGLYVVWATGDETIKQKLIDYGRTWAEAAMAEYPGKPRGLLPARMYWDTGKPEGVHTRIPPMRAMYAHLLACHRWTGDPLFLQPIAETLRRFVVEASVNDIPAATGYGKDADKQYAVCLGQLALVASLWRRQSGDRTLDAYFERWARKMSASLPEGHQMFFSLDRRRPGLWLGDAPSAGAFCMPRYAVGTPLYLGWEVTGDKRLLVQACRNLSGDLTDQWGPLTYWFYDKAERRVTSNDHLAHSTQWSAFALCQMTTGGPGPIEASYPSMAVTWRGGGEDVVPLVLAHDATHVRALLYNFGADDAKMTASFGELKPGTYTLAIGPDADGDDRIDRVRMSQELKIHELISSTFTLPAGGPYAVDVSPVDDGRP